MPHFSNPTAYPSMNPPYADAESVTKMVSSMGQELVRARSKIKEQENRAQTLREQAGAAEYALKLMRQNFEKISTENHRLKNDLDELRDSKVGIKQEKIEESELQSQAAEYKRQLESVKQERELCKSRYRSQKTARHRLRDELKNMKTKMSEAAKEIEQLKEEARKKVEHANQNAVSTKLATPSRKDIYKLVSVLPKPIPRLQHKTRDPVCLKSMDLKAYISGDSRLQEVVAYLLCLPDRIAWCSSDKTHAVALGPMRGSNSLPSSWRKNPAFNGLYGQTFHLFYTESEFVYYAGLYKGVDLRESCPEGISTAYLGSKIWTALAEATVESTRLTPTIAKLYEEGALMVEPLGLQCMDFDVCIYNALKDRFTDVRAALNPVGKRKGYFPEVTQSEDVKTKRQKKI